MEGNDENSIDEFALEMLRRAKERSQAIAGKYKQPEREPEKVETIGKIMEKLDKRSSDSSAKSQSPEKAPVHSPVKLTRPILKQMSTNEEINISSEGRPAKKCVTTFDADGTIVDSKSFAPDNEDSSDDNEGMDFDEGANYDDDYISSDGDANVNNLAEDEDEEMDDQEDEEGTAIDEPNKNLKAETTPKLSRTLKKIAEFHSKEEIDSPIHAHTPLEALPSGNETNNVANKKGHTSASRTARSSRLSALFRTINEWEDDTTHHSMPGSRFSEVPNSNARASLSGKSRYSSASSPSASSPKSVGSKQGQITGELQGYSRRQGSPLKQIREKTEAKAEAGEGMTSPKKSQDSPNKIYFGGSPYQGTRSPKKYVAPAPPKSPTISTNNFSSSPVKTASPAVYSPVKSGSPAVYNSPVKSASPAMCSPARGRSASPTKSPMKSRFSGSPMKTGSNPSSHESTPAPVAVSAIRMQFEGVRQGKIGPVKPERTHVKPYSAPAPPSSGKFSNSSSPVKKFNFGQETGKEKDPSSLSVAERAKLFEKSNFCPVPKKPVIVEVQPKKPAVFTSSPSVDGVKPREMDISSVSSVRYEPAKHVKRTAPPPPVAAASPGCPPPPPPMPTSSTPTNLNSTKRRSSSPARHFPAETHGVKRIKVNAPKEGRIYPSLTDIETETETETEGHCSEVESLDDSLESYQSLGTQIETIAKACSPIRPAPGGKIPSRYRPSEDFSATFACETVDALIDEALEGQDMTGTTMNFSTATVDAEKTIDDSDTASLETTVVKATAESDSSANSDSPSLDVSVIGDDNDNNMLGELSFSEADTTASSSFTSSPVALSQFSAPSAVVNVENPQNSTADVERQKMKNMPEAYQAKYEEEPQVPRQLVHTVSFYRKQQQQQKKPDACSALNDISEQPESDDESDVDVPVVVKPNPGDVIRKLEEEVEGRNLAIAQASKALTWCKALVGFSDSTEYIEGERILLIETQRRLALLNSINRFKTDGALSHQLPDVFSPGKQDVSPSSKGNMKISDISITLRREFFNAHRAENQYHFICLLKNKHHIEHTTLLTYDSQRQGSLLRFPNAFSMEGLDPNFQVNLEVYYLESAKEFLPHEAKYRINAKRDKQATMLLSPLLTPSKKHGKGDHGKSQMHSPAGPDVVKSTSFKFCGGLSIDISSLQRTYWELDKAAGPLSGGVSLKLQCSAMGGVEHKGFLTLFEDVSGYGAWVRRWCRLGPAVLEFWKYPEDETEGRKPPLGTLNLHECVTSKVRPAPRDVCARANTLLLVTTRAPHPNDRDTLVTSCHKGYTAVRHLISADIREERDVWCQSLNKALANLRAWDPVAKQSVDDNLF